MDVVKTGNLKSGLENKYIYSKNIFSSIQTPISHKINGLAEFNLE
jgi:hypothetical protein